VWLAAQEGRYFARQASAHDLGVHARIAKLDHTFKREISVLDTGFGRANLATP